jgi:hypothetical protein
VSEAQGESGNKFSYFDQAYPVQATQCKQPSPSGSKLFIPPPDIKIQLHIFSDRKRIDMFHGLTALLMEAYNNPPAMLARTFASLATARSNLSPFELLNGGFVGSAAESNPTEPEV